MDLLGNYSESSSEEDEEPEPEPKPKPKPRVRLPPPDLTTAAMKADDEKEFIYRSQVSITQQICSTKYTENSVDSTKFNFARKNFSTR